MLILSKSYKIKPLYSVGRLTSKCDFLSNFFMALDCLWHVNHERNQQGEGDPDPPEKSKSYRFF